HPGVQGAARGRPHRPRQCLHAGRQRAAGGAARDRHPDVREGREPAVTDHDGETLIAGAGALANFRQGLAGAYALGLLHQAGGRLLVQLPVGAGKTEWLVRIISHALTANSPYDLVIVLVPRWDVLRELIQRLPAALPRTVLHPRPRKRCADLDVPWVEYE